MSFWNKLKSVAMTAKCLTGWHAGVYTPIEGKPECNLEKICPDCDSYVTKKKHTFSIWRYTNNINSDPCDSIRDCVHCGFQEEKIIHEYKKNGKDSSCRIIEKCTRCKDEKLGSESHDWISLFGHDLKAGGKRKCKDCGNFES